MNIWKAILQWKIVPVNCSDIKPKLLSLKKGAIWNILDRNERKLIFQSVFLAHIAEQTRQPTQVATIIYYLLLSWFRLETQLSMHPNSSFRKFLHYTNFQNCASEGIRTSQIFSIHYFVKNPFWNSNIFFESHWPTVCWL